MNVRNRQNFSIKYEFQTEKIGFGWHLVQFSDIRLRLCLDLIRMSIRERRLNYTNYINYLNYKIHLTHH
jgi:hypothetical protein